MGKVNLNVTQINAGTAHNVIPDRCDFVIDIRPTEKYTNEELMEELRCVAMEAIERCARKRVRDWTAIKTAIKNDLSGYLFKTTKRNPMILPVIMEI